ncbi:hypothetical protein A6U91_15370 [Agrobacterium tumefaciens]|jgi:peptidoglycan/LPS O-acetylase OafA/YrhL|uniref:Acyltransferase 3 domain-containing protein n=2 Tax=Agrobacterium tumefaciens TaxID=358 RepID=A0AB36EDX5_AGRTU|nr:hypothetical protein A6U91_15370 [Agrobacterium tumefaciens]
MRVMDYFASRQVFCYFADHVSLLSIFPVKCWDSPGAFAENRIPSAPNGSLWALTPEIICYAYVLAFEVLGLIKTRIRIMATLAAILVVHSVAPRAVLYFSDVEYSDILKVGLFFMPGVFACPFRHAVDRCRYHFAEGLRSGVCPFLFGACILGIPDLSSDQAPRWLFLSPMASTSMVGPFSKPSRI